jgi:hypothetical protein
MSEQKHEETFWRKCNSCKKPIAFSTKHYVCSVSTCNGQRTGYVFCSVPCFEVHLPGARHKDAAAIEAKSPMAGPGSMSSGVNASAGAGANRKIIVGASSTSPSPSKTQIPRDVLIIASRLKEYIQARADMNTSGQVMEVLSEFVRRVCDRAIDNARAEGRKTVMERDFKE